MKISEVRELRTEVNQELLSQAFGTTEKVACDSCRKWGMCSIREEIDTYDMLDSEDLGRGFMYFDDGFMCNEWVVKGSSNE